MDSQVLGKFMCVLLCAVGVVVAEDECATYGQVYNYFKECFNGNGTRSRFELTTTCGVREAVRNCMKDKTANCAEKTTVMAEVDNHFSLCNGTSVSALAQRYLAPLIGICELNITAAQTCRDDIVQAVSGYPFLNETLSDGLKAVKRLKQAYFNCHKIALQANTTCTEYSWKMTYMHKFVGIMERLYIFGIYIDETDKLDFGKLQVLKVCDLCQYEKKPLQGNEIDDQQTPLNARDIFRWGLF